MISTIEKPYLFDLEKDSHELENFFGKPGYDVIYDRLNAALISQMTQCKDPILGNKKRPLQFN